MAPSAKMRAFKQDTRTGLCGPYAIVNALLRLSVGRFEPAGAAAFAREVASSLPAGFRSVLREGTDRGQMAQMLDAARAWTLRRGWPDWSWGTFHPVAGATTAAAFWGGLAGTLARDATAAIVGFGDDDRGRVHFEPHWTCIERIGPYSVHLFDSDEYARIARSDAAVRPQRGWEIEDCFILRTDGSAGPEVHDPSGR